MNNQELKHYGVLGMRWGKRGSTTPSPSKTVGSNRFPKKKVRDMSDSELRERINRIQMERQYKSLKQSTIRKGAAAVNKVLIGSATTAAGAYLTSKMIKKLKKKFGE